LSTIDFFEAVRSRGSYRKAFTEAPIPREHLKQILDAGIRAPSGYNGQSTSFVVVTDAGAKQKLISIAGSRPVLETAQAIIVVVMDPQATSDKEFLFGVEDYSAAVENMLLAITSLGYASVWIDGALRSNDVARRIGDLIGVPADREVRVILPVGVPAEPVTQAKKRGMGERAWFERWGAGN
jgi:nitroreductase